MTEEPVSYKRLVADPSGSGPDPSEWWVQLARTARDSAAELGRLHRLLDGHWRAGRNRDQVDELLRRLTHRLNEAQDACAAIAALLANRSHELAQARELVLRVTDEARLVRLVVTPEGEVERPSGSGPMPLAVRAVAQRLTAQIAGALAEAAAAQRRVTEEMAVLSPPAPWSAG
ncbi:hypothetical protein AB0J94_30010 [Micromonospora noduli]|uniref:Histidine kinase n=1 Tax=Micromonospora noduli TaxID=709876 RepID=A0A328N009_9ACTN|nr:hypothetical protein [Micromonospora noduli]KAB1923893.1 hypothetical protein F8280_14725 [Micromonospora noduli]RAN99083.1 hypothetical protein LAH08_03821 [Micromonospora noduli]RAO14350.1 hypothetical protein MED15_04703 [Micromonospora noduli]RAO36489.1 hypothetical protein ONO23_01546 [Micromonospora noduli]